MGKVTRAAGHLTEAEISQRIKTTTGFWRVQRWLVIRHALVDPAPAAQIGRRVGLATQTVHNLIARYNREGARAVESAGRGQRQRARASLAAERQFLQGFAERAARGEVTTVGQMKLVWEQHTGGVVHPSTFYRLLKRHGWRKLVPRPRHVQADAQAQEAFKKNSPRRFKR